MHCFFDVRVDIRNGNNRRIAYDEPVAHCRPGLQEGAAGFNEEDNAELCERANHLGREFVIQVSGKVNERFSKNPNMLFHPFVLHSGDTQQGRTNIPLRFQNEKRSAYPMETPATSVPKTAPG